MLEFNMYKMKPLSFVSKSVPSKVVLISGNFPVAQMSYLCLLCHIPCSVCLEILMALPSKFVQYLTTSPSLVQVITVSFLNCYNHLLFDFSDFIFSASPYLGSLQYGSKGILLKIKISQIMLLLAHSPPLVLLFKRKAKLLTIDIQVL